jgi:hypothetical protein
MLGGILPVLDVCALECQQRRAVHGQQLYEPVDVDLGTRGKRRLLQGLDIVGELARRLERAPTRHELQDPRPGTRVDRGGVPVLNQRCFGRREQTLAIGRERQALEAEVVSRAARRPRLPGMNLSGMEAVGSAGGRIDRR